MNSSAPPPPPARHRRCWRILGWLFLLAGVSAAGWIWWQGRAAAALPDDPALLGFDRASQRQMGLLYGKSGYLMNDLWHALKQPDTCALLILAASALLAGGCLLLSRLPALPAEPDFFKPARPDKKLNDRE